MYNLDKGDNMY